MFCRVLPTRSSLSLLLPAYSAVPARPSRPSPGCCLPCAHLAPHQDERRGNQMSIRFFGLQILAAPQVFYCESPSQIERAGGLELPFGTRSAASQHGGPVSPL